MGAVSGNRWYEPGGLAPANFVRAVWGLVGLAVMSELSIPWGGSMAIRREVVEASGFKDDLRKAIGDDACLVRPLWAAGWKFLWVPCIVTADAEPAGPFCQTTRWTWRQMVCVYIHHPLFKWGGVPPTIGATLLPTSALLGAAAAAAASRPSLALALLVAFGATVVLSTAMLTLARAIVLGLLLTPLGWRPPRHALARWVAGCFLWVYVSQLMAGAGAVWCMFVCDVEWRGVVYRRTGPREVRIVKMDGRPVPLRGAGSAAAPVAAAGRDGPRAAGAAPVGAPLIKCAELV